MRFYVYNTSYGTTYKNDICINLSWDGERNGEYEPYVEHSYPLDSSLTLRGIPKIANGKLYYDGDTYESDGTVTRKYGIVDLSTLIWVDSGSYFTGQVKLTNVKAPPDGSTVANAICSSYEVTASNNVTSGSVNGIGIRPAGSLFATNNGSSPSGILIYELATPTIETAEPFENIQEVTPNYGTEEFVTTTNVPVGNNTKYPPDDLGKLDMLANIPSPPNNNGTYTLEVTVLNGNTTYIWV
jgi:hypothetical protein